MGELYLVKELAEERGINISRLHILANQKRPGDESIALSTIRGIWHETTVRPDMGVMQAIAEALGVERRDLFAPSKMGKGHESLNKIETPTYVLEELAPLSA